MNEPERSTNIINCAIVTRPGETRPIFYAPKYPDEGACYVNMTDYIIIPKELLSKEEIADIWRRRARKVQH